MAIPLNDQKHKNKQKYRIKNIISVLLSGSSKYIYACVWVCVCCQCMLFGQIIHIIYIRENKNTNNKMWGFIVYICGVFLNGRRKVSKHIYKIMLTVCC